MRFRSIIAPVASAFLFTSALSAQYTTGSVAGAVTDPSGASVPGASVTLTSTATGGVRTLTTGTNGQFFFPALDPGSYVLAVSAPGFAEARATLTATSSATFSQDIALKASGQDTVVEVAAASPDYNVTDAQLTTTRSELEATLLPNLSRSPQGLVILEPAVSPMYSPRGGGATLVAVSGAQTGQIAAYGARGRATAYSLDYTDINDWEFGGFALGTQPSIDMIAEQKVFTGVFPAEFGLQSSNVVSLTRSGSNHLHGTAYDFLQNDALNARDYFDTTGRPTPTKQNVYGWTLGGPAWRDHTFFFGGYQKTSTRGAGTTVALLFPNTNALDAATDNTSRHLLQRLLPFIPAPSVNAPTSLETAVNQVFTGPADSSLFLVRGDHRFSGAHSVSARYLHSSGSQVLPYPTFNAPTGYGALLITGTHSVNLADTYLFSSNKLNELRIAYGRSIGQLSPQATDLTPRLDITGVINLGEYQAFEQGRLFNTYQISDAFSWSARRHALKLGVDLRSIQDQSTNVSSGRGIYTFSSLSTFLAGTFSSYSQTFGATTRNYDVSIPGFFLQDDWRALPTLAISAGVRYEPQGALTEAHGLLSVLDPTQKGAAIGAAGTGALGGFRGGHTGIQANYGNVEPRLSFAWNPAGSRSVVRGGFGLYFDDFHFALLSNIRVSPPLNYSVQLTAPGPGNSFDQLVGGVGAIQAATTEQIGTFGDLTNFGATTTVPRSLANPYTQNYTIGVQFEMAKHTVLSVDYLGSVSRHLTDAIPLNSVRDAARPAPARNPAEEAASLAQFQAAIAAENGTNNNRIDPRFNQVDQYAPIGSSNYNALAVQLKQAPLHGFGAQLAYTYAKSLDDDSDFNLAQIGQDLSYPQGQGAALRRAEYGPSDFDITHRVVLTTVWQLPFYGTSRGLAGHVLGGWNFSTIEQWQSGVPASIQNGSRLGITDVNLDGNLANSQDNTRASLLPGGHSFSLSTLHTIYNTSGANPFTTDTRFKYIPTLLGNTGTAGRDTFRTPGIPNVDWSLSKNLKLTERSLLGSDPLKFELRADAFNVFNLTFLTATGSNWNTLSSPAFGLVNTAGNTRKLQIAAKLLF